MRTEFVTLPDGTVTIVVETEGALERMLMMVFVAQTYGARQPASVLNLNYGKIQLIAKHLNDKHAAEARAEAKKKR